MEEEKTESVNFKEILEELSNSRKFNRLEKITDVFLVDQNIPNFMDFIMKLFGPKLGQGLFTYIISENNLENIPDKNLREALGKINAYKEFYGHSLRQAYVKMGRPFMIGGFQFTKEQSEAVAVITLRRNDDVQFSGQMDFNTSIMLAQQLIDLMGQMFKTQKEEININNIISLLNELAGFVDTVIEKQNENESEH